MPASEIQICMANEARTTIEIPQLDFSIFCGYLGDSFHLAMCFKIFVNVFKYRTTRRFRLLEKRKSLCDNNLHTYIQAWVC